MKTILSASVKGGPLSLNTVEGKPLDQHPAICTWCEKPIIQRTPWHRYCGNSCRRKGWRAGISDKHALAWQRSLALQPSPQLSWLLGYFFGDGDLRRSEYAVRISSVSRPLAARFATSVQTISPDGWHPSIRQQKDGRWICSVHFKALWLYLKGGKEHSFAAYMPVINAYPSGFLQGFFDAEGSISFRETDRRNILQKCVELINGDDGLVLVTIKCLNTLGFSHVHYVRPPRDFYHRKWNKIIHQRIPLHHIALIREVDIRRFANVIGGFTEPAKQGKLMDLIGIMDKRAALRRPA